MRDASHDRARFEEVDDGLRVLARRLLGETGAADDVVQDAWVALLRRPDGRVRSVRSWMSGTVRKLALDELSTARRHAELEALMAARDAEFDDSDRRHVVDATDMLRAAVQELDEPYRAVIDLRYFEGVDIDEIASRLGRTASTVRTQLSRGVSLLRERLARKGEARPFLLALAVPGQEARAAVRPIVSAVSPVRAIAVIVLVALGGGVVWRVLARPAANLSGVTATLGRSAAIEPGTTSERPGDGVTAEPGASSTQRAAGGPSARPSEAAQPENSASPALAATTARQLKLVVRDAEGGPVTDAVLVCVAADASVRRFESADGAFRVGFAGQELQERLNRHVASIQVCSAGEAWSPTILIDLPVEGRSCEVRTRGPAAFVRGVVSDPHGVGVGGVQLVFLPPPAFAEVDLGDGLVGLDKGIPAMTLNDGSFECSHMPLGTRDMRVRPERFQHLQRSVEINGPEMRIDVTLEEGATVRGIVRGPDGRPLADARVWLPHPEMPGGAARETRTDETGAYELHGNHGALWFFAEERPESSLYATPFLAVNTTDVYTLNVTLRSRPGLTIRLRSPDGSPARGNFVALFALRSESAWLTLGATDEDGVFFQSRVPDDPITIYVQSATTGGLVTVATDATERAEPYDFQLDDAVAPGALEGVILGADGQCPPGMVITLESMDTLARRQAIHDESTGAYRMDSLEVGAYQFEVVVPWRGWVALGERQVETGAALSLGKTILPEAVRVELRWEGQGPSAEATWTLRVPLEDPNRPDPVIAAIQSPLEQLELFPGAYELARNGTSTVVSFDVLAGAKNVVRVLAQGEEAD